MDNRGSDFYEPCELTIDIECDELPEELMRQLSLEPTTPPKIQREIPKPRPIQKVVPPPPPPRELRLNLRSPELRKRFERVIAEVPGRHFQAQKIFTFIVNAQNGSSAPLTLHGNTGCGKTSLIKKVLDFFQRNSGTVTAAYLNCMCIRTVNLIYVFMMESFFGGRKGARGVRSAEALKKCLQMGVGPEEKTKILVLDEIDHIIEQKNFLYNMLEWLGYGSKLILVLISNVIDLTVRLDGKLQSRMKFQSIIFQPYVDKQIYQIILYKYPQIREMCSDRTIQYMARRIYNINSDIRNLDKVYSRIQAIAEGHPGRALQVQHIKGLFSDQTEPPALHSSHSTIAGIIGRPKESDIEDEISHKVYRTQKKNQSLRKQDVLYILCDLQDAGLISLTNRHRNTEIFYHNYGIKAHDNLHRYVQNCNR